MEIMEARELVDSTEARAAPVCYLCQYRLHAPARPQWAKA